MLLKITFRQWFDDCFRRQRQTINLFRDVHSEVTFSTFKNISGLGSGFQSLDVLRPFFLTKADRFDGQRGSPVTEFILVGVA